MMQLYWCKHINILYLIDTKKPNSKYEILNLNLYAAGSWGKSLVLTNKDIIPRFTKVYDKDIQLLDEWED